MDNKRQYEDLSRWPVPDETMPSGAGESSSTFPANVEDRRDGDRFKRLMEGAVKRGKEEV